MAHKRASVKERTGHLGKHGARIAVAFANMCTIATESYKGKIERKQRQRRIEFTQYKHAKTVQRTSGKTTGVKRKGKI